MNHAQRAPVRPRVRVPGCPDAFLLEDAVARFSEDGARGLIAILGPAGSGKTTALRHLAASAALAGRLHLLDEPDTAPISLTAPVRLVVYAAQAERPEAHLAVYSLAAWDKDDWIEYLLARQRPRCAAVMARVQAGDRDLLGGAPGAWSVVLDRLAEEDGLPDVRRALHRHLVALLGDTDLLERARSACLNAAIAPGTTPALVLERLATLGFADGLVRVLRHPPAQRLLAAERIAAELHDDGACDCLAVRLPRDLVRTAASLLANDARAREHLRDLLAGPAWSHSMSASLLHAAGLGWAPLPGSQPLLAGAYLDGAQWPGVDLERADLPGTDLSGADLANTNMAQANAHSANLSLANLHAARLDGLIATEADLTRADLSETVACAARFDGACLAGADLDKAVLRNAFFAEADLTGASFREADLLQARFGGAQIEGADFTGANLTEAVLGGLCLRTATWTGARFSRAKLCGCDLEGLALSETDFTEANLEGALLTGSSMPGARFTNADLSGTGLADIDWEGADLRGANLRGSTFHMGSSRSGLVGSPIACEGSRTGFYTDDYDEQTYKAPEEVRKANLCGANLLGACLEGVDFYLVDLRGATFDEDQGQHLRRCGAILAARV